MRKNEITPRFKVDPLSEAYVRLIDIMFAFTLTQGFVLYRDLIANPDFSVKSITLILVYAAIILSCGSAIIRRYLPYPYNNFVWSRCRLFLDLFILVLYAYLIFVVPDLQKVILGLGMIFLFYVVSGLCRIRECDGKVSKPQLSVLFALAFFGEQFILTKFQERLPFLPGL